MLLTMLRLSAMPSETVVIGRQVLQVELCFLMAATVFVAAGITSIVLSRLRSNDPLLFSLGVFTLLYGTRLAIQTSLSRLAMDWGSATVQDVQWVITCCILIPCVTFFRELFGPRWRRPVAVFLWTAVIFAPFGIGLGLIGYKNELWTVNNALAIAGSFGVLYVMISPDRPQGLGVLRLALVAFLGLVIATNVGFRVGGRDVEPVGFAVLIAGLAYTAAKRSSERESKLRDVEHELETARRIQTSILPRRLPSIAGLQLAARYEPMTAVAGDFYDFLPVGDHGVAILVADVSGHGVPAALIASMLKVAFAAQADHARDPARILSQLNATLAGQLDGQFVTAACAFIDVEARNITYAGAGHPPALLVRGNGEVSELVENGLLMGIFSQAEYRNIEAPFQAGDRLVLYTDGIIEATLADGEQFGLDRLKDFARRSPAGTSDFADRLIAAVTRPVREDDLTVVVAEAG